MNKKQRMDELNKRADELLAKQNKLVPDILGDDNYEEFEQCATDKERKQKFPELFALHEQLQALDKERDSLYEEIEALEEEIRQEDEMSEKVRRYEELKQETEKIKKEQEFHTEQIRTLNKEIEGLKNSQAYKEGNAETVRKVEELAKTAGASDVEYFKLSRELLHTEEELKKLAEELEAYINEGKEKYKEVEDRIKEARDAQIKRYDEYVKLVEDYDKEYESKLGEIDVLKNSKEYIDGDEETIKKVERLQGKIEEIGNKKREAAKELNKEAQKTGELIKELEKEKQRLIEQYGQEIVPVVQAREQPNNESPDISGEKSDQEIDNAGNTAGVTAANNDGGQSNKTQNPKTNQKTKNRTKAASNVYGRAVMEAPVEEAEDQTPQQQFEQLYAKAKRGELSQKDFDKLAEIMQDPSKYDELGITTGRVFNKAKVIFKAMASRAAKNAKTIKLCEEKFGIKYEKASKENRLLSASSLKNWKDIQTLIDNPNTKIASEEFFKQVVEMDRESLSDEEKVLWDAAKERLGRFEAMRCSLKAYSSVTREREQTRRPWFSKFRKETPKALSSAPVTSEPPKSGPVTLSDTLATHVVGENKPLVMTPPATRRPPTRNDR